MMEKLFVKWAQSHVYTQELELILWIFSAKQWVNEWLSLTAFLGTADSIKAWGASLMLSTIWQQSSVCPGIYMPWGTSACQWYAAQQIPHYLWAVVNLIGSITIQWVLCEAAVFRMGQARNVGSQAQGQDTTPNDGLTFCKEIFSSVFSWMET